MLTPMAPASTEDVATPPPRKMEVTGSSSRPLAAGSAPSRQGRRSSPTTCIPTVPLRCQRRGGICRPPATMARTYGDGKQQQRPSLKPTLELGGLPHGSDPSVSRSGRQPRTQRTQACYMGSEASVYNSDLQLHMKAQRRRTMLLPWKGFRVNIVELVEP